MTTDAETLKRLQDEWDTGRFPEECPHCGEKLDSVRYHLIYIDATPYPVVDGKVKLHHNAVGETESTQVNDGSDDDGGFSCPHCEEFLDHSGIPYCTCSEGVECTCRPTS